MALLKEGQIVRDTYEVERLLGEGAFGEVYRVRHRFLGRQALKLLKISGITLEEIDGLMAEARLLSALGHPNIVRVFDANITETAVGRSAFVTMEYVAGGSLDQFWQSHGAAFVPVEITVDVIRQACRGLAVAHLEKPPVVHRDIKPQNLLVGYDAAGLRVRVSDFGLAKRVNPLTLAASARGTKCFKSPEALLEPEADSCAGDVWALGCTLYLLLTDRFPFQGMPDDPSGGVDYRKPIVAPSRLNAMVDPLLERITLQALSIDPKLRFANASVFLKALEAWQPEPAKAAIKAHPGSTADRLKSALGCDAKASDDTARAMVRKAVNLAKQAGRLTEAADILEEAMNRSPGLRGEYEYQLRLWRRGITM